MNDATLAFYQQFYADLTLYVVPEAGAAVAATPAPVAAEAVGTGSASAPVAPPAVAAPVAPAAVVAPTPTPPVTAQVPTLPVTRPVPPATPPTPPISRPVAPAAAPVPPVTPPRTAVPTPPVTPPVSPVPPQRTAPPLTETPFSTLGSNRNGIIILVRLDAVKFQRLPRHVFLNNVLKAIGQIVEDTVLINVESHLPVALSTLRQQLAARQIIGFGKNLLDVAVHKTQLYEPVLLAGDAAYLPAAELEVIEEDRSRKKMLWQAMQRMFLA